MYGTSDQKSVFTLNTVGRSSVFPKTSTQDHLSAQLARAHMVNDGISLYSPRDKGAAALCKEQYKGRIPGFQVVVCIEVLFWYRRTDPPCRLCSLSGKGWFTQWGEKGFVSDWPEQPRQDKNILCRHDEANGTTKEGPCQMYSVSSHLSRFQSPVLSFALWSYSLNEPPSALL